MKKIMLGFMLSIMLVFSVVFMQDMFVFADDNVQTIDSVITIEKDTELANIDYVVSDSCSKSVVFNVVAGTLILDSCSISASTSNDFDCVFNVSSSATLILKNTTFADISYTQCVVNAGVVEIDNVTFIVNETSILNNGSYEKDSIKYYSGNLESVTLNSGYISVYENTKVDKLVKVGISNFKDMTLAVKGVGSNVFASKFIEMFEYTDNKNSADDNNYYFDYIGDFDTSSTTINDASGNVILAPGDIVLTALSLSFNTDDTIMYAPKYCSSYAYLKAEFDRIAEGEDSSPIVLYKSNALKRTLDNFSANMSAANFSVASAIGSFVTLTIKCVVQGEQNTILNTSRVTYLSGSNHAVFVDLPEGYEYESIEFLKGNSATDVVGLLNNNAYANGYYIRPIIEYKATTYSAQTITANVIVKKKVDYAKVVLDSEDEIVLNTPDNMVVGSLCKFELECKENEVISDVRFNGDAIVFEYDDVNDVYTFNAIVLSDNIIYAETKIVLTIVPNPERVEFEFGDEVVLKESYKISDTKYIDIVYVASEKILLGVYDIDEVECCSDDKYIIEVSGNKTYSIVQKRVDLGQIVLKTYTVNYSEDLVLDKSNFLVSELPSYLSATLDDYKNFVAGEQYIRLNFATINSNYVIINERDYLNVTLNIIPKNIDTSNIVFVDVSSEYTGSKIEVSVSNYDANIIDVEYIYYLANDLTVPIDAINVGSYVVKAIFSSNADVYSVSGEKTITLTITPKEINMADYLQSIEVTEYIYDGQEKSIDLKESALPTGVKISGIDKVETQINANIYYYVVSFETESDNYTCVESKTVALKINPIIVTISLLTSSYDYTGKAPNLAVQITNVIDGDSVSPIYENAIESSVGSHTVRVLRLNNTNYALENVVDLEYEIISVSVDMSEIGFENIETTYDGNSHRPVLTGVLPLEITYVIDSTYSCVNAGTYNIKCTFVSSDAGIVAPQPIYATVVIHKRELSIVYSEPSNMIANGEKKQISVDFLNVVVGDEISYALEYSNDPILAGEYTCRVKLLDETNYVLKNNAPYRFMVFMSTINYSDADVSLSVSGKFSSRENLTVSKINDKLEVINLLAGMEVKNYLALNFSCVSFTSDLMTISVDAKDIAEKINYLKAYRIKDNKLEEIEYTIKDGIISFKSTCNEKIIFVENYDFVYTHRAQINAIIVFAIISMGIVIVLEIIHVRNKKKSKLVK